MFFRPILIYYTKKVKIFYNDFGVYVEWLYIFTCYFFVYRFSSEIFSNKIVVGNRATQETF